MVTKSSSTDKNQPTISSTKKEQITQKINTYRYNRNVRTIVLVVLLLIVLAMLIFRGKMKVLLRVLLVVIITALGLHVADYDIDIGTFLRTHNLEESRVQTKKWVKIIGTECQSNNLNCADFATQSEAQTKYETCATKIAADNAISDKNEVKRLDVYGLDWDKDGIVCEALPKNIPAIAN